MAKAYVCDACGRTMQNPHEAKMKKFYMGTTYEFGGAFFCPVSQKTKVHLCDDCYHALREIAEKKKVGEANG